ncbi:MAG TPA: holo-ACP synthase [Thermomicrobiales bacterium]|nr:holo-[acyl-carrier-protein] synthase [Chloroflexota bacterium]HCG31066.1 holo-[acyl-carrier-protein] synthase [Chloroflexota bacterium]HQX62882.1 holo-ACP synthase [Thermomicrobiales bacterium]HQZ88849.1 holo-ACP synthase [Thermomicrobiales bacterium]HRA31646.1 holo-ACP synthase [Thermomicrobiales bacterium]
MSASGAEYEPIWDSEAAGPVEVGIDIIEIERIGQTLERFGDRFLTRVYSPRERERYGKRVQELAARFAAKEATMKALGTGVRGVRWRDIEVLPNRRGKPILVLHDTALRRARLLGFTHFAVSLTHSRGDAMAIVIASKGPVELK